MVNTWMQFFKDALYVAEQFLNEKKPGQYPPDVLVVQTFIGIVLRNPMDVQIEEQLRKIVTDKTIQAAMSEGLIIKPKDKLMPGKFFRIPGVMISIQHDGGCFSIGINEMLKTISDYGKRTDNAAKSATVNLFVTSSLSQMFTTYITQIGSTIGIEKKDRDAIVSSTVIEPVTSPYTQGQTMSALKGVFMDGLATPAIRAFVDKQLGPSASRMMEGAIKNFDGSAVGDIQGGMAKAMATQKIGPLYDAVVGVVAGTAGNFHAEDGVKAYDQE